MTTTTNRMAEISATAVKELRERTGAGMMDCKKALEETAGDMDQAVALLRERARRQPPRRPAATRAKASSRPTSTPAAAGRADRGQLRDRLRRAHRRLPEAGPRPRHAGRRPRRRSTSTIESIPAEVLEAKRAELMADETTQKKPENIRAQIVDGQLRKWYQSVVLYEQPFRDTDQTRRPTGHRRHRQASARTFACAASRATSSGKRFDASTADRPHR